MSAYGKNVRYEISPVAKKVDRAMTHFIKVGGVSIIVAVFAIFLFIFSQIFPLFRGAEVTFLNEWKLPEGDYIALGTDEWTERPFVLREDGTFVFLDLPAGGVAENIRPDYPGDKTLSTLAYRPKAGYAAVGTDGGEFAFIRVAYRPDFTTGARTVRASVELESFHPIGEPGHPLRKLHLAVADNDRMVAAIQDVNGAREVHAVNFTQRRNLMGGNRLQLDRQHNLTGLITGKPTDVLVNTRCDSIMVITDSNLVHYLYRDRDGFVARQVFEPFADYPGDTIAAADFLFGDDSIIFTSTAGHNKVFSLFVHEPGNQRLFGQTKQFPDLPGASTAFSTSLRNKSFLVAGDRFASLRFSTTETVRWEDALAFPVTLAGLSGKYDRMLLVDDQNMLHIYALNDPHPEASLKAFFGKIWYEGASAPKYEWQSTGGTDDFEPKLSMVPLIIGTLKGTVYAMIFSVPLALLAALYTSQFASPGFKRYIKPLMEIMASLPSVILGFLAALWLAPILETRVPSVILVLMAVPITVLVFGTFWGKLPFDMRRRIPEGAEIFAVIPIVLAGGYLGWQLGPWLEQMLFVVRDPATGQALADFRLWWPHVTGLPFEQRNSLVVGFMMGFAVIPIIFTITEDALSNVPPTFRSSSLALGASRWQTAIRVILPTASAGIFSAIMIGFGRAVGETMIVLMATGNTPIMDFNIFSGMRTLSANIAVELPEAPHHGTLYRALFLGSMLLFMMTFAVNTLAEILRHHLREKYKAV
ncbi:MAG TPA: ABC transporter permease subunit [Kiritimatiellia bacterium]|nr:ABC transporter permease subunit [Kiritimatiellia bacterium]HMO97674.1 ABC transporter permease subunit [Kiritimatiellia bacterium]HMP95535.1 ABC transporter permease subunit [Kiritimatiellia bacterium]